MFIVIMIYPLEVYDAAHFNFFQIHSGQTAHRTRNIEVTIIGTTG